MNDLLAGGPNRKPPPVREDGMAVGNDPIMEGFPYIFAYLAQCMSGNEERTLGRLSVWCSPGQASVCLSDKHTGHVCFGEAPTIHGALEALEASLANGTVQWKKSKGGPVF